MRQFFQSEKFQLFMHKVGTPLFKFGQKLASETIPNLSAKYLPEKFSKPAANIGSTAVGGVVAAAAGMTALQTPITLLTMLAIGAVQAWPVIVVSTLVVGAGATVAAFVGAGMAYSGAQQLGLARGAKNTPTGAAGAEFDGVGAAAAHFDPEKDFVGAAPTNDNKRFATVNAAPEGKTSFGEGLEAKGGFNRAHNGTPRPDVQKAPATGAAPAVKNEMKNQPKPPKSNVSA